MKGQTETKLTLFSGIKEVLTTIFKNNNDVVVSDLEQIDDWDTCVKNMKSVKSDYSEDEKKTIENIIKETARVNNAKKNKNKIVRDVNDSQVKRNKSKIVMDVSDSQAEKNRSKIKMEKQNDKDQKVL